VWSNDHLNAVRLIFGISSWFNAITEYVVGSWTAETPRVSSDDTVRRFPKSLLSPS
jgi:hypothetical protein